MLDIRYSSLRTVDVSLDCNAYNILRLNFKKKNMVFNIIRETVAVVGLVQCRV